MFERSRTWVAWVLAIAGPAMVGSESSAAAFSREAPVAQPPKGSASGLPFRLYQEGLIVVEGSIAGADKHRFLIDTGAMRTVIHSRVAEKLGLAALDGVVRLCDVKESRRVGQVIVPELKFGPVQINDLRAVAGDLLFLSSYGTRIDAIIGLDVLRSRSFSVDYAARRITFGTLVAPSPAVPFETTAPLLIVTVQVEDQPMRFMVDTGARNLVLFDGRAQRRLPKRPWRLTTIQSPMGRSYVRELELGRVRLCDTEWRQPPALLMQVPAFADGDLDGILAPSPLRLKRLEFDFDRNLLGWAR